MGLVVFYVPQHRNLHRNTHLVDWKPEALLPGQGLSRLMGFVFDC